MIKTKWNIITGSPSSGKSSVLEYISMKGNKVYPEVARVLMKNFESKGNKLSLLTSNKENFEKLIYESKINLESITNTEEIVFFDRSLIDSFAFAKHYNSNIDTSKPLKHQYNNVFYLEPLPYINDAYRLENEKNSLVLTNNILFFYKKFGYNVIRIPKGSIEERANLILKSIEL